VHRFSTWNDAPLPTVHHKRYTVQLSSIASEIKMRISTAAAREWPGLIQARFF
jgi:hypothetical protein